MINFSGTENISNLIDLEKVSLMSNLDIQKSFYKQILVFMKKFMSGINFSSSIEPASQKFSYLNESTTVLNKSNSNIDTLNVLLGTLSCINPSDENFEDMIKEYNSNFKISMNTVYENTKTIEQFIHNVITTDFSELPEVSANIDFSEDTSTQISENTLIISETQKKVFLPYDINKVKDILQKNKRYHSVEDVVNKLYTRPISYYKFPSISRFKEAYHLVKDKEKGSTFKALSLAFELLGNYNLHPAIITACKSLDELDIYLACLEENDLDDFKFFNIKYDIPMTISKANTLSGLSLQK